MSAQILNVPPSIGNLARRAGAHAVVADELCVLLDHVSVVPERDAMLYFVARRGLRCSAADRAVVDLAGHAAAVVLQGANNMSGAAAEAAGTAHDFARAAAGLADDGVALEEAKFRALEIVARRRTEIEQLAQAIAERGHLTQHEIAWLLRTGLREPLHVRSDAAGTERLAA